MTDRDAAERARLERDFFAEAEDIFERAHTHLGSLQDAARTGRPAAPIVNLIFREIHALKGVAGSLGFQEIADLAHALEDLLDRLRSAGAVLDAPSRDRVDESLEALAGLVRDRRRGRAGAAPRGLAERLRAATAPAGPPPASLPIDPRILASLSRHEEDRLRACFDSGGSLFLVRAALEPAGFDVQARAVAAALAEQGELVAMLPEPAEPDPPATAGGTPAPEGLPFVFLLAARRPPSLGEPVAGVLLHATAVGSPVLAPGAPEPAAAPAAAGNGEDEAGDASLISESVRVPVTRLDDLLGRVADLSIAVAALAEASARARDSRPGDRDVREVDRRTRALQTLLKLLQRGTVQVRLVPLARVFAPLARLAARTARASGKLIDLEVTGSGTEVDKAVMDELAAPLRHLVLNALDHGIEDADERLRAGKGERARVALSALQRAGRVVIEVADDGRGIDAARVRAAAEATGQAPPGAAPTGEQALSLIFLPGVSTAPRPGPVSGRGVGLDAVRGAIRRLKGSVAVRSVAGRGTTFTLSVPISLALVHALIVRVGGRRFAIPIAAVRENLVLDPARVRRLEGREVYDLPRGPLPLRRLGDLLKTGAGDDVRRDRYAVVARSGAARLGLVVDELIGRREIVIKPLGGRLRDIPGVAGATDLGDATAVLVLDPEGLMREGIDGGLAA